MEKKYKLVIVESPSKAKTIEKYLGTDYKVIASKGHIMDLPPKALGVNLADFSTELVPIVGKESTIKDIVNMAKGASEIFLASDDDREGESIAHHLYLLIKRKDAKRMIFNVVTKPAILEALKNPLELDQKKYEAQQTRRILDRIIGYKVSPILWEKIAPGLSAGRVQSVTLKIIVKREEEILKFVPEKWFEILANFNKTSIDFTGKFIGLDKDKALKLKDLVDVQKIVDDVKGKPFTVVDLSKKNKETNAQPPYTTSKLQQEAASKLGFSAKNTMQIAQKLYEGVDVTGVGRTGLITYMRTDSVRTEPAAMDALRLYIKTEFGDSYLTKDIVVHKQKKSDSKVQDAHEAIRPANLTLPPSKIRGDLSQEEFELYQLIWNKFIASQMSASQSEVSVAILKVDNYFFRTSGSVLVFDGYKKVFNDIKDDKDEDDKSLPILTVGESLTPIKDPFYTEKQSSPPPRFNEGTLVKELEEKGIGRPSTYATLMETIKFRKYVDLNKEKRFFPTPVGSNLCAFLELYFPEQMDIAFTSKTEQSLDDIEEGNAAYKDILKAFWKGLETEITKVKELLPSIPNPNKIPEDEFRAKMLEKSKTGITCTACGKGEYLHKKGANGDFLACSMYPECKSTQSFEKTKEGKFKLVDKYPKKYSDEVCKTCGKKMIIIEGKNGKFLSCEDYPTCKSTAPMPMKISCQKCATGKLLERKSKAGNIFYGCNKYPDCNFVIWDEVIQKKCKDCNFDFIIKDNKTKKKLCYKCKKEQK